MGTDLVEQDAIKMSLSHWNTDMIEFAPLF